MNTNTMMAVPDPMVPHPYRVRRVQRETYDTFTLDLEQANGARGLPFAPGQFNMIYIFGVGEVPISISGDPAQSNALVHTVRAVGTVTKPLVGLKRGDMLGVRGPFGSPWPVEEAKGSDVVIVAGGIGLAPLRPALYYLLSHRESVWPCCPALRGSDAGRPALHKPARGVARPLRHGSGSHR